MVRWDNLRHWVRRRRVQNVATLGLVLLGPVLAFATFLVMGPLNMGASAPGLRLILLGDFVYVLLIAALVLQRVARMVAARRARSAGSRLHLRLTGVFALMALIPTVTVAVFAVLTINIGLETWFSDRVRQVVGASLAAAKAYQAEQREDLSEDARALANYIDAQRRNVQRDPTTNLRKVLTDGQSLIQRGLREAYLIDGTGELRTRGERSYLFDFERPTPAQIAASHSETPGQDSLSLIEDWANGEFRAIVPLEAYPDRYLYISRVVNGELLNLLDNTQQTAQFYQQQESERGRRLFDFALIYLGFALLLVLASIWLGLWFAERLARPVGRLTGAAQRVGAGDLDVQVREEEGDDEIAMLSRYFNQMTKQLKGQRETLLDNTRQIERRRRLFDSVLSSVTSGVVGLDDEGRISFVNRSAERLLGWSEDRQSVPLTVAVPEFGPLFAQLTSGERTVVQHDIKVVREGRQENLLVRMATRSREDGGLEGYVVAFDDVSDLVAAQRMAAWGDVARRIAHEIKNPLTPIQLSAERISRKFSRELETNSAVKLEELTGVIVRQTNDLRRIVDEFSKFARMPEPERAPEDVVHLLRGALLLQESGQPDVSFSAELPDGKLMADLDATMISQALTNLIKNAGEAIETLQERGAPEGHSPMIRVTCGVEGRQAVIRIMDNGIGLPEDRARLFEPYVTTRDKGTGLGLPIVKKIIEEHGGSLALDDAPPFNGQPSTGAMAVIRLPLAAEPTSVSEEDRGEPSK
ncbi:ATP-binding protein [Marinovum sp. KMM 9879]